MPTSIRRLASIVTRYLSLINSRLSNLTPNGPSEGTVLRERPIRVRKESREGQGQRTGQCLHDVHCIITQADANCHASFGSSAPAEINDIVKHSLKESGGEPERGKRRRFLHARKNR
jgi:hypothetical protein